MDTPDPSLAGNEKKVIERETPWFGMGHATQLQHTAESVDKNGGSQPLGLTPVGVDKRRTSRVNLMVRQNLIVG